jgi:hypothetical protein
MSFGGKTCKEGGLRRGKSEGNRRKQKETEGNRRKDKR